MNNFYFKATNEAVALGIKVLTARISGINNNSYISDFEEFENEELTKIKNFWNSHDLNEDTILQGFRDLHEKVGRSNKKYVASPEVLLNLLIIKDRFPKINPLVDIYNFVSLKSRLALGAHDIEKINGGVTLKLTNGNENFTPLGKTEREIIQTREYAYVDKSNNVICRLEVLQCDTTKILPTTKDIFLIVQGNANTDIEYLKSAITEVYDLIKKYCGGEIYYL